MYAFSTSVRDILVEADELSLFLFPPTVAASSVLAGL
jgi:hypothetical protein